MTFWSPLLLQSGSIAAPLRLAAASRLVVSARRFHDAHHTGFIRERATPRTGVPGGLRGWPIAPVGARTAHNPTLSGATTDAVKWFAVHDNTA